MTRWRAVAGWVAAAVVSMSASRGHAQEAAAQPTAQLVINNTSEKGMRVRVQTATGVFRCPAPVNRQTPCIIKLPPGEATIVFKNGTTTTVMLPEGPTEVTLTKDRWTLTVPGVVLMSAGLIVEIVGAAADNNALTVSGLLVMGVGAGVLLVGIALPNDVLEVKHEEFTNTNMTRGPEPVSPHRFGLTATLRF